MIDYGEIIDKMFSRITQERGRAYAEELRVIINENVIRGRLTWYLKQNKRYTVEDYIEKVCSQYDIESGFIKSLQVHKSESAWANVQYQAQTKAYRLLLHLGFLRDVSKSISGDIAQDACVQILHAHYPYDSAFEAWLTKICVYIGRRYAKQRWVYENNNVDVEEAGYRPYENSSQIHHLEVVFGVEESELKAAIQQLSPLQREIIEKHYMQGQSFADISKELKIISNVLYKRHSDARKRLRKILGK